MLFFKIEGTVPDFIDSSESVSTYEKLSKKLLGDSSECTSAYEELCKKLLDRTSDFNHENAENAFFFFARFEKSAVTVAAIVQNTDPAVFSPQKFFQFIDLNVCNISISEITLEYLIDLIERAEKHDFIDDSDKIKERFHFNRIIDRYYHHFPFDEYMVDELSKDKVYASAGKCLMNDTLLPELNRIYATKTPEGIHGHPAHYLIESDDANNRKNACYTLLSALYDKKRIFSKRYTSVNVIPDASMYRRPLEALYKVNEGGTMVIRYFSNDNSEENQNALCETEVIDYICELVRRYRNRVLTVLCLPRECTKCKAMFFEKLGMISLVEIKEDLADFKRAKDFLKTLAEDSGMPTDRKLFGKLQKDKGYLIPELHAIFDIWYDSKLKASYYPLYKTVITANQEVIKAAPKGSAYDKLQEMIGLAESKKVIDKALSFYKVQKLCANKGIKQDRPSMHMVFTGNPGTAKTTVARLFARIMAENGLLSKGHLIEVGRGDLVGKYVGWTAQIVQKKFKAASGGVLFIDEAYSLVDDRSGSYGDEAINTIVQEMENHRKDMIVIFAGYPDKMEEFLQKNPGLRSRIAFHVPFADYSPQELCGITELLGKQSNLRFTEGALLKLERAFEAAMQQADFGNGRYARNLLEQAQMGQAERLIAANFEDISADDVSTIIADDIPMVQRSSPARRRIGF